MSIRKAAETQKSSTSTLYSSSWADGQTLVVEFSDLGRDEKTDYGLCFRFAVSVVGRPETSLLIRGNSALAVALAQYYVRYLDSLCSQLGTLAITRRGTSPKTTRFEVAAA